MKMFEIMLVRAFQALLKTSICMIPFLVIIILLENRFRKQYSAVWKYSLFWLILLRLILPIPTGKNENLTLGNILPAIRITEMTNKYTPKYDNKKSFFKLSKSYILSEKSTQSEIKQPEFNIKTITIPKVQKITIPEMPKIKNTQYSFFTPKNKTSFITTFAYIWFFVVITKLFHLFFNICCFIKK